MRIKKNRLKKTFLWFSSKDDGGAVLLSVCTRRPCLGTWSVSCLQQPLRYFEANVATRCTWKSWVGVGAVVGTVLPVLGAACGVTAQHQLLGHTVLRETNAGSVVLYKAPCYCSVVNVNG